MVIKPRVRGFMCITSHPKGCAANVKEQIDYIKQQGVIDKAPKRVLVIGASTGYGLASRITAAFGGNAKTLGIFFEKPGTEKKPGTAGWYNSAAFHHYAEEAGLYAKSINGDAFSDEVKDLAIKTIKEDMEQVDLVVYSLASPRRKHPKTGEVFNSTLKPIGSDLTKLGINTDKKVLEEVTLEAATDEDIAQTVAVMGGEDWQFWIEALAEADVLANGAKTTAYTYFGEKVTKDIYWNGTIGQAKQDLDKRVTGIREIMQRVNGDARVSVLKGVVTQSSSAIPIMPLYLSLLFRVMKAEGTHEGCIEQIYNLFVDCLYSESFNYDELGRLRVDLKELKSEVQEKVEKLWSQVTNENLYQETDFAGYEAEFLRLFGFGLEGVDYDEDVETLVPIAQCIDAS